MTPQQIVGLAVRLFAIWLALTDIRTFDIARVLESQPNASETTIAPYVFSAAYVIVAVLLWFFPLVVAHNLMPRTRFTDNLHLSAREAAVVACVIFGLGVALVFALPILSRYISIAIFWVKNGQPLSELGQAQHVTFVQGLIYLAVGVFFIVWARPLAARTLPDDSVPSKSDAGVL